jgi:NADH-quinone oxidoreductase subunit F
VRGHGHATDVATLLDICAFMGGTTICALADGAAMPLRSYPQKFKEEFDYYIREKKSMMDESSVMASH